MTDNDPVVLLNDLIQTAHSMTYDDDAGFKRFRQRGAMILRNIHGGDSPYLLSWQTIGFTPTVIGWGDNEDAYQQSWWSGMLTCISVLEAARDEQLLFSKGSPSKKTSVAASRRVFVVHGRDEGLRESVAYLLQLLDLDPIILHKQPNMGRTIIEKFEDYADVSFAVVLLTPDDLGYPFGSEPESARPRARQNVVLELGFFLGLLGRERVAPLFTGDDSFETPSDYDGVTYIPVDKAGKWKYDLATELQAAGIDVDKNKIS